MITVLPEYAVDIYYTLKAGAEPGSDYVKFAAANMTGANRLLIGIGWPLIAGLYWWRSRGQIVPLRAANAVEIAMIARPPGGSSSATGARSSVGRSTPSFARRGRA